VCCPTRGARAQPACILTPGTIDVVRRARSSGSTGLLEKDCLPGGFLSGHTVSGSKTAQDTKQRAYDTSCYGYVLRSRCCGKTVPHCTSIVTGVVLNHSNHYFVYLRIPCWLGYERPIPFCETPFINKSPSIIAPSLILLNWWAIILTTLLHLLVWDLKTVWNLKTLLLNPLPRRRVFDRQVENNSSMHAWQNFLDSSKIIQHSPHDNTKYFSILCPSFPSYYRNFAFPSLTRSDIPMNG